MRVAHGAGHTAICDNAANNQRIYIHRAQDIFQPRLVEGGIGNLLNREVSGLEDVNQSVTKFAGGKITLR